MFILQRRLKYNPHGNIMLKLVILISRQGQIIDPDK